MPILVNHPLIQHKLSLIRNKETGTKVFRENIAEISGLLAYEITRDIPVRPVQVETPLKECAGFEISREIVLIPVLRAGLGMVSGITNLIPAASVGHIGIYRDHESLEPHHYYTRFPGSLNEAVVLVLDPMLATGGSASATITKLKAEGATMIKLVCIVGAPEGLTRMETDHPDVEIYLAALDEGLNDKGYILPGLGDAGDRLFGTG